MQTLLLTRSVEPDPKGKRSERAKCMLAKILDSSVIDVFVNGNASNEQIGKHFVGQKLCDWSGNYDPPPISEQDFVKFLGSVRAILGGPGFARVKSDSEILQGLSEVMFAIADGIVRVQRYIVLQSTDTYSGDRTRIKLNSIFSDHLDDPKSIYSCYKDFTGNE